MNYGEALAFLDRRQETRWKLGLCRIEALVAALGDPQKSFSSVHVAGTNGKGSFCAILASILRASGRRVGLFVSPHLVGPDERIRVDGRKIPPADLARMLTAARDAEGEEASYFELMTAAAFLYFKEREVDIAVIEVGLGGRLDATNVLRPVLSVITSIDIDHTLQLGTTPEMIAREKAGILKPDIPCLCAAEQPEARAAIRERARGIGAPFVAARPRARTVATDWEKGRQEFEVDGIRRALGLLGGAAARNAALALSAVDELGKAGFVVDKSAVARGLAEVDLSGRFQILPLDAAKTLILDGAHNLAAMRAFLQTWKACPWKMDAVFIFGVLKDKDYEGMIRLVAPYARRVIATRPGSRRALSPEVISVLLRADGVEDVETAPNARAALKRWRASGAPVGVVLGSFYLVGEVLAVHERVPA